MSELKEDKIPYGFHDIEYEDGQVIKTVMIGDGSIGVTDILYCPAGHVGIGLYPAPGGTRPGEYVDEEYRGRPVTELNLQFQLLFDNPVSIDVVIERLQAAKKSLLKESGSAVNT